MVTKELVEDFKNHVVWRELNKWIEKKQESIKENLLSAKSMEEVTKLQTQHDTYKSLLIKVNTWEKSQ